MGALEYPFVYFYGVCQTAVLVTEQLTFGQLRRDCATVNGNKRFVASWTLVVDGSRGDLFTGAAFAADQHRRACGRHAANLLHHLAHFRTLTDELTEIKYRAFGFRKMHLVRARSE